MLLVEAAARVRGREAHDDHINVTLRHAQPAHVAAEWLDADTPVGDGGGGGDSWYGFGLVGVPFLRRAQPATWLRNGFALEQLLKNRDVGLVGVKELGEFCAGVRVCKKRYVEQEAAHKCGCQTAGRADGTVGVMGFDIRSGFWGTVRSGS